MRNAGRLNNVDKVNRDSLSIDLDVMVKRGKPNKDKQAPGKCPKQAAIERHKAAVREARRSFVHVPTEYNVSDRETDTPYSAPNTRGHCYPLPQGKVGSGADSSIVRQASRVEYPDHSRDGIGQGIGQDYRYRDPKREGAARDRRVIASVGATRKLPDPDGRRIWEAGKVLASQDE